MKKLILSLFIALPFIVFSQIPTLQENKKDNYLERIKLPSNLKTDEVYKLLRGVLDDPETKNLSNEKFIEVMRNSDVKRDDSGFVKRVIELLETLYENEENELDITIYHIRFYERDIATLKLEKEQIEKEIEVANSTDEIDKKISRIRKIEDSINGFEIIINEFRKKNNKPDTGTFFSMFKKERKAEIFKRLYSEDVNQNLNLIRNTAFQLSSDGGVAESELISSFLGPSRVSIGTIIASVSNDNEDDDAMMMDNPMMTESTETEAFQRLIAGGGNLFINFELPIFTYLSKPVSVYLSGTARFNLDLAEVSGDINTSTGNGNLRGNIYVSFSTDDNSISFFGNASFGHYFGNSSFTESLNIMNRNDFSFGQVTTGLTISNKFRISATLNTLSNVESLRSGKVIIGAQILSGLFEKK